MIEAGPSGKQGISSILLSAPEYDEDFLWNLQSNLRQEIEAQFIRISTHELELYTSSVALFDKINLLQRELGTKRKRKIGKKRRRKKKIEKATEKREK